MEIQTRTIHVKIEGLEPGYMQSRLDPHDLLKNASGKKKTGNDAGDPRTIEETVQHQLYINAKKQPCIPSEHIFGCLLNAAKDFQVQGRRGKSYREVFASSVKVLPGLIPISPPTWETDLRVAHNRASGGRVPAARPKFPGGWTAEFNLLVEDSQLVDETVKRVLEHGGTNKGIGSFRPTNGGPFGRFLVRGFSTP